MSSSNGPWRSVKYEEVYLRAYESMPGARFESAVTWNFTMAGAHTRALTARHPIKPTPRVAAPPLGSLTPADVPLIDAENLFETTRTTSCHALITRRFRLVSWLCLPMTLENARIGFNNNLSGPPVAGRESSPLRRSATSTLKEHQPNGYAIQLLWAARPRRAIVCSAMFPVALGSVCAISIKAKAKSSRPSA